MNLTIAWQDRILGLPMHDLEWHAMLETRPNPNLSPNAKDMPALPLRDMPLVEARADTLAGYGELIDSPEDRAIEIVTWPAQGWRQVDAGTGNEGGTTEGVFEFRWSGDLLLGHNAAVGGRYVLGWGCRPALASESSPGQRRERLLLHHANYHPDGGQLFFPLDPGPFVVPLALPGDDVTPESFQAFWFAGGQGFYIHPNVWHETIVPLADRMRFFDRQSKVHARVSVDFPAEFGCYPTVPLTAPPQAGCH